MAARRLNEPYYMLRGHAGETTPGRGRVRRGGVGGDDKVADDDASQIDALKRLLPGADNSEYKQVVLLGAAASGKSVLLTAAAATGDPKATAMSLVAREAISAGPLAVA